MIGELFAIGKLTMRSIPKSNSMRLQSSGTQVMQSTRDTRHVHQYQYHHHNKRQKLITLLDLPSPKKKPDPSSI